MKNNTLISTMETALLELAPTQDNIVLISDTETYDRNNTSFPNILEVSEEHTIQDVLTSIGSVRHIGIINPDKMKQFTVSELMDSIPHTDTIIMVAISDSPISCKVIYSEPKVGTKYQEGNYEYHYGQSYHNTGWANLNEEKGWGVKVVNYFHTDYAPPLTRIKGYPVTNMACLFMNNPATTLNLIDWDTSMITDMNNMFHGAKATTLNLSSFDTSNVTNMSRMFWHTFIVTLDLSNFDTYNANKTEDMFKFGRIKKLIAKTNLDMNRYTASCKFPRDVTLTIKT